MRNSIAILILSAMWASGAGVLLEWEPSPTNQQVTAYYIYRANAVSGPWACVASATTTNYALAMTPCEAYFYVTASNFWGESVPSNILSTPPVTASKTNVTIKRLP